MTLDLSTLNVEEKADLRQRVELQLARQQFPYFLRYVVTEDVAGNEEPAPLHWPHVREFAKDLDAGIPIVLLKARQLWISWELAAYALFTAMLKGGNVLELSQGQTYSRELLAKSRYIYERLPAELRMPLITDNKDELQFRSAGRIMSFPSTSDAGRGFAARLVIADEAAFHAYASENYRAWRSTIADGGQPVIVSTANGPHGWFHSLFDSARKGKNDYAWRFFPWHVRPDRQEGWYEREKRAFEGFVADFVRENPATPDEAFTSLSGLVYRDFNPRVHVAPPRYSFEQCRMRIAGVDFGGSPGNPNAVVILGLTPDDHIHQYDEFAVPGVLSLDEIGGFIAQWKARAPLISVECDHDQVAIATLVRQFGLPARKANKARGEGLEVTEFLLKNNRLTIDPGCIRSIEEFYGYRWRESLDPNTRERYQTATPVDHHGDLMDARRYALMQLTRFLRQGSTITPLDGQPLATRAV